MQTIGFFKRLFVIIYDGLLLLGVIFVVTALMYAITPNELMHTLPIKILRGICLLSISFFFYGWFWTHGGQTLGMKTWQLYLIDEKGKFINWKTAFLRYCAAILSWATFGLGFSWILLSRNKLAWHDILTNTRIVKHQTKQLNNSPDHVET